MKQTINLAISLAAALAMTAALYADGSLTKGGSASCIQTITHEKFSQVVCNTAAPNEKSTCDMFDGKFSTKSCSSQAYKTPCTFKSKIWDPYAPLDVLTKSGADCASLKAAIGDK
jgi:hypothetical protein